MRFVEEMSILLYDINKVVGTWYKFVDFHILYEVDKIEQNWDASDSERAIYAMLLDYFLVLLSIYRSSLID